jgi:hypothetical protein
MKKSTIFSLFLFFSALQAALGQSGWTQPQGAGFFKASQGMIRAGSFFNPEGEVISITTASVYISSLYGEYGINDRLTALLDAPLFVRSTINNLESRADGFVIPGDEFNGLGDIGLGLQYGIVQGRKIVLAASGRVKLPTGESVGGKSELLQSGDGAWGFTGMLHASHSFYPRPFYASLSAGYQWRGTARLAYRTGTETADYDDALRWNGEIGWAPAGSPWRLALKLDQVAALENGTGGALAGGSSIFGNRISFLAITPELSYILDNGWGMSASVGTVAAAKNILAAPLFNLGVVYVLKQ